MDKYRFDDAYEKVYEYLPEQHAYIFYCTYYQADIKKSDSEAKKIEKVEDFKVFDYLED